MEADRPPLPIGRAGALHAVPLTNTAGTHAVLVRQADEARALITGEPPDGGRERVVVVPLDDDVEVRVDGDALAVWLSEGSLMTGGRESVPAWASVIGLVLLLVLLFFALIGSLTFFGWLFDALA
jgi:hypothetical protein